ncbi:hypothetical protein BDN67DRAFT_1014467 [Paxillus ammoniavirescens]|nr:hypothetical protein BDN67DRAFT_1014467 [Paxillus ammoniavirescens]
MFGMNGNAKPTAEAQVQPHTTAEQQQELEFCIQAIKRGTLNHLRCLRRGYIVSLAQANNMVPDRIVEENPYITLCRIWGGVSSGEKETVLLCNFLSLVIAVRWATMRTTSTEHAAIITQYLTYYVQSTDAIFGEMELTILRASCQGSNLRALLARDNLPGPLQEMQPIFNNFLGSGFSATVLGDILALGSTIDVNVPATADSDTPGDVLERETYIALISRLNQGQSSQPYVLYLEEPQGWTVPMVKLNGVMFATGLKHTGDSYILFKFANEHFERAGQIKTIFAHR